MIGKTTVKAAQGRSGKAVVAARAAKRGNGTDKKAAATGLQDAQAEIDSPAPSAAKAPSTVGDALPDATRQQVAGDGAEPPFLGRTVADVRLALIGQVAWLMMNSRAHRHLFMSDLEWLVVPPVSLRQMRLWRKDGRPVIYASWAEVSEEVEKRILSGVVKLAPQDWKSGDRLWLIDVVAPWGGAAQAVKELSEQVFKGRVPKTLRGRTASAESTPQKNK